MTIKDVYNYDNPRFSMLRDPMRRVMGAFGNAEKWFATLKEWALMEAALPSLSDAIHALEHKQPERIDLFADGFRPWHLMVEYPPTDELAEDITDVDYLFEICLRIIAETNLALLDFAKLIDDMEFRSMIVAVEEIMAQNNADRSKLMQAAAMWDTNPQATSFDNFVRNLFQED